jgi:hypothetical protein
MAVMASCDFAVDMTYEFSKGASLSDVNPTINIYNASDGFTVEETTVMSSSILSVNVTCFENDTICWGAYSGDTEWGCGKNCSATDSSYCVSCKKDETIPVSLEPQTGTMTWTIVKDLNNANPTINFYDVDSDKTAIKSNVKLDQATTTTSVTCKIGNMICIGADFELAGEDFVIGCGEGCVDYEDYETDLINSNECQPCVDGNADQVNYTNFI